jgi:hypothetical protein
MHIFKRLTKRGFCQIFLLNFQIKRLILSFFLILAHFGRLNLRTLKGNFRNPEAKFS